jgi:hypothetical protein
MEGGVGFPAKGAATGVICLPGGSFCTWVCWAGVNCLMAFGGKPAPTIPLVGIGAAVALGIWAVKGGMCLGGGMILGLPRLAEASFTLATGFTGGRGFPMVRAGGWMFLMATFLLITVVGAETLVILVMLVVLLTIVLFITVWLILVTREI